MKISIERLGDGPIIRPDMDARMGDNINGPSLIRAPDWLPAPLGRYYLYFGHHDGRYIRLAYADSVAGPWRMHEPGVLPITESGFKGHIASPDVYVDDEARQIRLYFHGADLPTANKQPQYTRVALSSDGLNFETREEFLGRPYMRTVPYDGQFLSIAMPGIFYRSRDGLTGFEVGPSPFHEDMRHAALLIRGNRLLVFYSQIGHEPERILLSEIDLSQDWMDWRPTEPRLVLEPERDYEGGDLELRPSIRGWALEPVRELRDPAVFVEDGAHYLLYSVAGENGIALAQFELSDS